MVLEDVAHFRIEGSIHVHHSSLSVVQLVEVIAHTCHRSPSVGRLFRNGISQGISLLYLNLIIVYGLDGCQLHALTLVGCQFGVFIFSSTHILTYHNLQRTGEVLLNVEDVLIAHSSERVVQIRRMHRRAVPCCGETRTNDALAL